MSSELALKNLNLSVSTFNRMTSANISTVDALFKEIDNGIEVLLENTGLNNQDIKEIWEKLNACGLLADNEARYKLRSYFRWQPISFLDISNNAKRRLTYALGEELSLHYFSLRSPYGWYTIIQDYDECISIANQLGALQLNNKKTEEVLKQSKDTFLREKTSLYLPIEKLDISKKLCHTLIENNIYSVEQLVNFSAVELREKKIAGDSALASLRKALHSGRLLLRDDYVLKCANCGKRFIDCDTSQTICDDCEAKRKRISKISKLEVTITGPEYSSFTNLAQGFILYINIKNLTPEPQKVRLNNFYVVEDDKQISPNSFLDGYIFDNEVIIPGTVQTAGKIWDLKRFSSTIMLFSGTYAVLSIKLASEEFTRIYKYVYWDEQWRIDDYFTV